MGTSQSSKGPRSRVPLIPPWAEPLLASPDDDADPGAPADDPPSLDSEGPPDELQPIDPDAIPVAPLRRFASTRSNIGSFARSGDAAGMRRGIAHYVREGYGGRGNLTRRMGSTSATARSLSQVLDPTEGAALLDRALLQGRSASEVMDAVVEASRVQDGTLDAETSRDAIRNALSELYKAHADVDLLNLTDEQRAFVIEHFVAHDVYGLFLRDVGKHLIDSAPDVSSGLGRLKQIRSYIQQTIAESFRRLRDTGQLLTGANVQGTVTRALADSFAVFEGYLG